MPVAVEEFWDRIQRNTEDRFKVAAASLKADKNGELVNSINANGDSLLIYVLQNEESWDLLLDEIANHPLFNSIAYAPEDSPGSNAIHEILVTGNSDILKKFIGKPEIIFNGPELSWVEAHQNVLSINTMYQEQFQQDPNSAVTKSAATQLAHEKLIRRMLRDATNREALKIWNTSVPEIKPEELCRIELDKVGNLEEQEFIRSYIRAGIYLAKLENAYEQEKTKAPNSAETQATFIQLANAKLMRLLFRDTVLEIGVERNKPSILDGLEAAGDRIENDTQEGENYLALAKKDEKNIKIEILTWHKTRSATTPKLSQVSAAFLNKQAEINQTEHKLEETKLEYYAKRRTVFQKSFATATPWVNSIVKKFKLPLPSTHFPPVDSTHVTAEEFQRKAQVYVYSLQAQTNISQELLKQYREIYLNHLRWQHFNNQTKDKTYPLVNGKADVEELEKDDTIALGFRTTYLQQLDSYTKNSASSPTLSK